MIHPSSVLAAVAVVEEWVLVERPQRSEDERPGGATSDGENGRPRKRRQVKTTRFSDRMLPEVLQTFWAALQRGEFITDAAAEAGTYRKKGTRWLAAAGGVRPRRGRDLQGRYLSFAEREEIALARAGGESMRSIGARLGRSPSTISRELGRNRAPDAGGYRVSTAHALAYQRASRPKPAKLATNLALREHVERDLGKKYSPEQIAGRLRVEFPDQPEMQVSHETICECRCGAPAGRTTRLGAGDPGVTQKSSGRLGVPSR